MTKELIANMKTILAMYVRLAVNIATLNGHLEQAGRLINKEITLVDKPDSVFVDCLKMFYASLRTSHGLLPITYCENFDGDDIELHYRLILLEYMPDMYSNNNTIHQEDETDNDISNEKGLHAMMAVPRSRNRNKSRRSRMLNMRISSVREITDVWEPQTP